MQLVALHVPQDICVLQDRLIHTEELLQAALDLVLIYVLLDTHVQVLRRRYALQENIRLQAQLVALTVLLDTIAQVDRLMHMEELLQAALVLVADYAPLVIHAQLHRLINMEEHQ